MKGIIKNPLYIMPMTKYIFYLFMIPFLSCISEEESSSKSLGEVIPLFDGKTFDGWDGNNPYFRIEEGSIIAGTLDSIIPQNEFLCTEEVFTDFELSLEAKLIGEGNNAGVQFRTERIPNNHEVIGYQYDIGFMRSTPLWASLYDESRRKRFLLRADSSRIVSLLRPEGWNKLKLRCEGNKISFWFNDEAVLEYIEQEPGVASSGKVCVQIHSGAPSEAYYRNIEIRTF